MTANNQELGSQFHSFAAKRSVDCLLGFSQVSHFSFFLNCSQDLKQNLEV